MWIMDGFSQASQREHMTYTDQHGRTWEAYGDVKAKLHPASPLMPKFAAPWYPNQRYAQFGTKNPTQFTWDYEAMLSDAIEAHTRYRDLLLQAATHYNVPNWDPATQEPTAQMKRDVGQPPLPIDPIRAARAGNGYILGLRPFDPARPGDVKLRAALVQYEALSRALLGDAREFADDTEFADEPVRRRRREVETVAPATAA